MSSSEQQETLPKASDPAVSPARSDKSSDSEGRPVREKFQKTSIDATANPISGLGQTTVDSANGSLKPGSRSASGSDSERGRLRRKRSREDVDDDIEGDKQPDKKHERLEKDSEKGSEKPARHARKRSRDITKDLESGALAKPATTPVSRIEETDAEMASPNKSAPKAAEPEARAGGSPKNKRPRDDTEGAEAAKDSTSDAPANGQATKASDERETKRVRDKAEAKTASSIPAGSGFANTSAASPFAAMAAKPAPPKASEKSEALPQTSDDKFKASGFASLANSSASPFGSFGAAAKGGSPFGGGAPKLSSFASPAATSSTTAPSSSSGFGALGSTKPSFGSGSGFGGASSSPFGGSFASKPLGGSSFATPGAPGITGLSSKPERAFGAPGDKENDDESDNEDDDDDPEKDAEEGRRPSQPLSSTAPTETGEEHEVSAWVGRAKLYTMDGEGKERGWKERGTGNIKLNVTKEEPKKARFVLRADGTHRLILNAAVTKTLVFGADSEGAKPKDGRLLFNSPNADGNLDMHLLKLKSERAVELWEQVAQVQNDEL